MIWAILYFPIYMTQFSEYSDHYGQPDVINSPGILSINSDLLLSIIIIYYNNNNLFINYI